MLYYKLVNELPKFNIGDKFYRNEKGNLISCDNHKVAYSSEEIKNFPSILSRWFELVEGPDGERWRGEIGDEYYYVGDDGIVYKKLDFREYEDNLRYKIGDYTKTEEDSEAYKEYLIARQMLLDDAKGGKWKKNGINLCVYYENGINRWIFDNTIRDIQISGAIYFQNRADTQKSLKEHKEQWEIVRKYEMGEE